MLARRSLGLQSSQSALLLGHGCARVDKFHGPQRQYGVHEVLAYVTAGVSVALYTINPSKCDSLIV